MQYVVGFGASVDAAMSVLGRLSRGWGEHGYRVSLIGRSDGSALLEVHHSDGSVFWLANDRWGNEFPGQFDNVTDCLAAMDAQVAS